VIVLSGVAAEGTLAGQTAPRDEALLPVSADVEVHLDDDVSIQIGALARTQKLINQAVWGIAAGVMAYGAINVTALLIDHGVHPLIAPLLSLMVDLAMCVGLWSDRVLHQYGRRDGWVTALRWITAGMTLALNIARPCLDGDPVGVGIHALGPVLLLVVAEAAGSIQRKLTEIIQQLQRSLPRPADRDVLSSPGVSIGGTLAEARAIERAGPRPAPRGAPDPPAVIGAESETRSARLADVSKTVSPNQVVGRDAIRGGRDENLDSRDLSMAGHGASGTSGASRAGVGGDEREPVGLRAAAGSLNAVTRPSTGPSTAERMPYDPTASGSALVQERPAIDQPAVRDCRTSESESPFEAWPTTSGEPALRKVTSARPRADDENRDAERPGAAETSLDSSAPPANRLRTGETAKDLMWRHWTRCRQSGATPSGVELDEAAGTSNYGRAVLREWRSAERITAEELQDAQRAARLRRRTVAARGPQVAAAA
jgi:hypothetical protein